MKLIKVWAVIPHDFEYSVLYFNSEIDAQNVASTIKDGADVSLMEMPKHVVERKGIQIAKGNYKV